ncbi:hypothetical protein ATW69_09655 [Oenococcus oeni]|uniref:glycosyltransferase family 4 protein n=1 Tax=Oenococcus oeni TaxID=1247 RepID=UPI0008F924DE|nr:glycosyltransferase family 4 protein [Oenococcus oeni]OIL68619.1 hypothetical protein ATX30_07450 [Oenococcus oeni]OIM47695.1 hypothetical protein ATX76_07510 [Oenococcus oeni]OLQ32727.1 hypothetical protein ATW69_09655 [Oenococcus oeni]
MRISFVFPKIFVDRPIGGYKILFYYANALARLGHQITIIFLSDSFPPFHKMNMYQLLRMSYHKFLKYRKSELHWFNFEKGIKIIVEKTPLKATFPDSDVIFATAASTARIVNELPSRKGIHFYFIQHDESTFDIDYDTVESWKMDMHLMAISSWIKKRVESVSKNKVVVIPNFIDTGKFGIDIPISNRKTVISMLYNTQTVKGCKYGIDALFLIKKKFPKVKIILFGVPDRPKSVPFNFKYIKNANDGQLRSIYNESSIYILPSILEGWGLTATDAMQCGAALVTTKNKGVDDFTKKDFSAIKVATKSSISLMRGIEKLLLDDRLRQRIAINGNDSIQKFTFNNSINLFQEAIKAETVHR